MCGDKRCDNCGGCDRCSMYRKVQQGECMAQLLNWAEEHSCDLHTKQLGSLFNFLKPYVLFSLVHLPVCCFNVSLPQK